MYEITNKGLWVRWSQLDTPSKWLFAASNVAAVAAIVPFIPVFTSHSYRLGYFLGSGGKVPRGSISEVSATSAWWMVAMSVLAAILWWRMSVWQDELFNRVQNWSLGMAGAWSTALFGIWAVLATGRVLPPVAPGAIVLGFFVIFSGFWFHAVRRWAS